MHLALVTSSELLPSGGVAEDRVLAAAMQRRGFGAEICAWDAAGDWSRFDGVLLRSCWDYHLRIDEFRAWLDRLEAAGVAVWNPLPLVRWNLHKSYLGDLARRGAPVVPTFYLDGNGLPKGLSAWLDALDATRLIVKPTIGATAHDCRRLDRDETLPSQIAALADHGEWLLQPFLQQVVDEGEWSVLWLAGEIHHAVLKRPKAGDFRVQVEWGGTAERLEPDPELVAVAVRVVAALDTEPLYARVDLVRTPESPLLMELELIEPELFLAEGDPGVEALIDAIVAA